MDSPPQRSGLSELSHAELLLCDFLWEHRAAIRFLEDDVYSLHMNVGYSHGLTSTQLYSTLARMRELGFITASADVADPESVVTLTPSGGMQWSLERQPRWDHYISHCGNPADNRLTVVAPSERLGRLYIGALIAADIEIQSGPIHVRRAVALDLLPWQTFQDLTVLRFACYPQDCRSAHWDIYSENRSWWTTLAELSTLSQDRA